MHRMIPEASRDDPTWRTGRAHKTAFETSDDALVVLEHEVSINIVNTIIYIFFFMYLIKYERDFRHGRQDTRGNGATGGER